MTLDEALESIEAMTKDRDKVLNQKGLRFNEGKLRFDLLPPEVEKALAEVLTFGVSKGYPDRNWERGIPLMTCLASLKRHINAWESGEDTDPESGLNHMKHVLCNAAFIVTYIEREMEEVDDRPIQSD